MSDDVGRLASRVAARPKSVATGAMISAGVGILVWEVFLRQLVVSISLTSGAPIEVLAWLGGAFGTAHIFVLGYCLARVCLNRLKSVPQSR